jgi:hypothetical protein
MNGVCAKQRRGSRNLGRTVAPPIPILISWRKGRKWNSILPQPSQHPISVSGAETNPKEGERGGGEIGGASAGQSSQNFFFIFSLNLKHISNLIRF